MTEYDYIDERREALAKFLEVDENSIDYEGHAAYFTVNKRKVKRGTSPEQFQATVADFKSLFQPNELRTLTSAIRAIYRGKLNKKLLGFHEPMYDHYKELLQSKTFDAEQQLAYDRLKAENLHVENVLYHLLHSDLSYGQPISDGYRRAWLGIDITDTREDTTTDDGEYLVLTDSEADDWEREGVDQLVDDIVDVPSGMENYFDRERWIDDHTGMRGNNISGYDGIENEIEINGEVWYIYRTN